METRRKTDRKRERPRGRARETARERVSRLGSGRGETVRVREEVGRSRGVERRIRVGLTVPVVSVCRAARRLAYAYHSSLFSSPSLVRQRSSSLSVPPAVTYARSAAGIRKYKHLADRRSHVYVPSSYREPFSPSLTVHRFAAPARPPPLTSPSAGIPVLTRVTKKTRTNRGNSGVVASGVFTSVPSTIG